MTTTSPERRKGRGDRKVLRALVPRGRIARWRRLAALAQAAVVVGLPFVTVGGRSALRFDVSRLELHLFGAVLWMDELVVGLAAALALTFGFLLVTVVFGRLWCGWGCPQTALVDLTGFLAAARKKGGARLLGAHLALALVALLVGANLTWYVVPPGAFFRALAQLRMGSTLGPVWLVASAVVWADLAFWRERFCAGACPYAKLQGALLDRRSLVIAYDAGRDADCVDCDACVRVCPVGIDIRDGLQAACTTCARCVDACAPVMRKLKRRPKLVGYFFGEPPAPAARRLLFRPAVLALAVLTAASLTATVALAAGRAPLDVEVTLASDFAPRRAASGEAHLALDVALENRGRAPLDLVLALTAPGVGARLKPDRVALAAGEHRRLRVHVTASGLAPGAGAAATLTATAVGEGGAPVSVQSALTLAVPGGRP